MVLIVGADKLHFLSVESEGSYLSEPSFACGTFKCSDLDSLKRGEIKNNAVIPSYAAVLVYGFLN